VATAPSLPLHSGGGRLFDPACAVFVADPVLAILLVADGLPVQPWVVAVPLLAGGAVPFALIQSFYRPSSDGLLAEHGMAAISKRGGSVPLGIGVAGAVALVPAPFVLLSSALLSAGSGFPRGVDGWMIAVTTILIGVVVVESIRGGSGIRRPGGVVSTRTRRLWIERFETVNCR